MKKLFIHVPLFFVGIFAFSAMANSIADCDRAQAQKIITPHFPKIQAIIDTNTIKELGIITDLKESFGKPATVFGQIVQEFLITHPVNDLGLLEERAKVINSIKSSPELQALFLEQFAQIAQHQNGFLAYWHSEDEIAQRATDKVYFGKKFESLNTKPIALELNRAGTILNRVPSFIPVDFYMIGGALLGAYVIGKIKNDVSLPATNLWDLSKKAVSDTFNALVREHNPFRSVTLGENADTLVPVVPGVIEATLGDRLYNFMHTEQSIDKLAPVYHEMGMDNSVVKNYGDKLVKATLGITLLQRLYFDVLWYRGSKLSTQILSERKNTVATLHEKIRAVAHMYQALEIITAKIQENPGLAQFSGFKNLQILCADAQQMSQEMAELVALLKTDSVRGSSSVCAFQGRILAAHQLMKRQKDLFGAALFALGELETYVEVARTMRENKTCFVEFTENGRTNAAEEIYCVNPLIETKNSYNPVILKNRVYQDFAIGTDISNMIITGPNGCGKSTVLKNLAYTIISAQVFNIAFADSCHMTPFARVLNYSKIEDNLKEEMSTFMAEVKRIEDIKQEVANNPGRVAVFVDEALKGTLQATGEPILYNFCKELSEFAHCFLANATHFELPTELEANTNGAVTNFYLEPLELGFGEFEPTYTLQRGKAEWWFADQDKRDSYITWLNKRINA